MDNNDSFYLKEDEESQLKRLRKSKRKNNFLWSLIAVTILVSIGYALYSTGTIINLINVDNGEGDPFNKQSILYIDPETPPTTTNIKLGNNTAHVTMDSSFISTNGLISYWGFDLLDFNDTRNISVDYSPNNISGIYQGLNRPVLNGGVFADSGRILKDAGDPTLVEYNCDGGYGYGCTDSDLIYNTIAYPNRTEFKFNTSDTYSVSFWFKMDDPAEGNMETRILGDYYDRYSSSQGWVFSYMNVSGIADEAIEHCYMSKPFLQEYTCIYSDSGTVKVGTWNYVSLSYNGSNSLYSWRLWVNGVEYKNYRCGATSPTCGANNNPDYSKAEMVIGQRINSTGLAFSGFDVDEVMVFNKEVTNATFQNIYRNVSNRFSSYGLIDFPDNNFTWGYKQMNISFDGWEANFSSNITALVYNGTETGIDFTDGKIHYNMTWLDQSSLLTLFLYTGNNYTTNKFITSLIRAGITLDLYDLDYPSVIFNYQKPIDINSTNALSNGVNITYNITSPWLNESTIKLYYKINSSLAEVNWYVNGTINSGYIETPYENKTNNTYLWHLDDHDIYPARYNIEPSIAEFLPEFKYNLSGQNNLVKTTIFNITNTSLFNWAEVSVNNLSDLSQPLRIYYCNSSHVANLITTSTNCINFWNIQTTDTPNHIHDGGEIDFVAPFAIINGSIGTVKVTPVSSIVIRGANTGINNWAVNYINVTTRPDQVQVSTTTGLFYTNVSWTSLVHVHQFNNDTGIWYYACANNTFNRQNCSEPRHDIYQLGGLPPSAPFVYSPANTSYPENSIININYTASQSPNGYAIVRYNISLYDYNFTYVSSIVANNSVNLSYAWNTTGIAVGSYIIKVMAFDNNSLSSTGFSEIFSIYKINDQPLIPINITSENGGRISILSFVTDNRSKVGADVYDAPATTQASNYTSFRANICASGTTCAVKLDSLNITSIPLTINLTLLSSPNMGLNSLLNLTWNWTQSNMNAWLTDYGIDSTRTNNVSPQISLKAYTNYSNVLNSSRANNYFTLRLEPI